MGGREGFKSARFNGWFRFTELGDFHLCILHFASPQRSFIAHTERVLLPAAVWLDLMGLERELDEEMGLDG
jgi:hypothetical protein